MNQYELLQIYNKENRETFNPALFQRSTDSIIEELKNVILSCQRDGYFKIRVESFEVVEDFEAIQRLLFEYEEKLGKIKSNKKENVYKYINLKDSDIKLLIVNYYIAIREESEVIQVYIAVPRIVEKFYFRIGGNIYSAMYQIVDASTYNNSTSNNKKPSVTLKTVFMPTCVYRLSYVLKANRIKKSPNEKTATDPVKCTYYLSKIFKKLVGGMKYILGKYGLYDTLKFLDIQCIYFTDEDIQDETMYSFLCKNNETYINVPRILFEDPMVQSLVYTIYRSISKDTKLNDLFTDTFWLNSLGEDFSNGTIEKGLSILESLEGIYDISTKNSIALPPEQKETIYHILRWMMREFGGLKNKDNLDLSTKKIRYEEFISSLYAMKVSKGLYRVADLNKKAKLDTIKKAISTHPTFLLGAITKCRLVNYRNMVNDLDALTALKFTYKGVAGLGEQNSNSIADIYRAVHPSHVGRVDLDASSATDPGITGTLCPLVQLYDKSFSEFEEPNFWEAEFDKLMKTYKDTVNLKEVATFKKDLLNIDTNEEISVINESLSIMQSLFNPIEFVMRTAVTFANTIDLEEGGMIYYED